MTRFTIVWLKGVQRDLAELWMDHFDRSAVAAAANNIDLALAYDPSTQGGELREGLRFLIVPPLRVLYSVNEGDRMVEVVRIRLN